MKFATFNTDGTGGFAEFEVIDGDEREAVDYMKSVVDGYLESIHLHSMGVTMWINEEGKLLGLPFNPFGTMFWELVYGKTDYIVGNIVLTGYPNEEGYLTGLTESFVETISGALHDTDDCPHNHQEEE